MRVMAAVAVALLAVFCDLASASSVTPIEKVVELLNGMVANAKKDKHEEEKQWTAYQQWCSDAELNKQNLVKKADITIESLQAAIEKADDEAHRLGEEVSGHQSDLVSFKGELPTLLEQRENESKAYSIMHEDYSESIHAITEATKVVKDQNYDRPQAVAMLQHFRQHEGLLTEARHRIDAFLAEVSEESRDVASISGSAAASSTEPGVAHGYSFQSQEIIDLLENLQNKFTGELRDLEKEELKKKQAYEMQVQDLHAQIAAGKHESDKKSKHRAEEKQASADATAQLTSISSTRKEDMDFLQELKTTCNQKAEDFDKRLKLRQEEIEALGKAVGILNSKEVAGAAKEHLPALAQHTRSAASLLQLGRSGDEQQPAQSKARIAATVGFLQKEGARLSSSGLAMLAVRVQEEPADDVFGKVKQMIQGLIERLEAEAADEATHKEWCDKELGSNEQTRTTKQQEVDRLHLEIEQSTSQVSILKREIADLSKAVATLLKEMEEETKMRQEESDHNEATIADAAGAQMAVGNAITMLKNYYEKAAGATSLAQKQVQKVGQAPPPIFDKSFKGQQTESDNIVAFLQVIQSDFARLESEVSAAEGTAQSEYDDFKQTATEDKEAKEGTIKTKQGDLTTEEAQVVTLNNDLDLEQADLVAALEYYEKLKPSCVASKTEGSFNERVRRREEEVASLKDALEILNGQTIVSGPQAMYSSVEGGNRGMDIGITAEKSAKYD